MPRLPINQKLFANVDELGNDKTVVTRFDVLRDDLGNNRPRFRLALFAELGIAAKIDGLFEFEKVSYMAAIAGGKLYKVEEDGTVTEITISSGALNVDYRASMADFGDDVYFCNNSAIIKWTLGDATAAAIASANAPTNATHIGFFDQYLLALIADSQRFEWSDVGLPDVWLGEFANAGVRPDDLQGLFTAFGEIALPGKSTFEYWSDLGDELSPFGRLSGTETERGVIAPNSVTLADNTYFFLDNEKRVVRLEGRAPKVISNPIDTILQGYSTVEDAIGFHVTGLGLTLYVLTFPTEGKTWAYNYKLDDWAPFSFWNDAQGKREAFLASSAVFKKDWDETILGSGNADGKIYKATYAVKTDNGAPMRGEIITGDLDHGTSEKKRCEKLRLKFKRGTSGLEGDDSWFFQLRDDGETQWGTAIEVKLGKAGDTYAYVTINNLGRYISRQWRITLPSVDTLLIYADELLEA